MRNATEVASGLKGWDLAGAARAEGCEGVSHGAVCCELRSDERPES